VEPPKESRNEPSKIRSAALTLGVVGSNGMHHEDLAPLSESDILIVQNDTQAAGTEKKAQDSAKMGEEPGTHTGSNMGATPENDTDKVDQPERRNETTGGANTPASGQ
jgi:hypothetical protein